MRNYAFTPSNVRKVGARLTIRDNQVRFAAMSVSDAPPGSATFYDAETNGTKILRICTASDVIHYEDWTPDTTTAWVNSAISVYAGSKPALFGTRMFYQDTDEDIYYRDFSGGTPGAATLFWNTPATAPYAVAPVSATELYALYVVSGTYAYAKLSYVNAGVETVFPGRIYLDPTLGDTKGLFDAIRVSGIDYVYFSDAAEKRTLYIKKNGAVWSDIQTVIPLDVVDDISQFRGGYVSEINSRVWMSGLMQRAGGQKMHVYSCGPEMFSLGRDSFIVLDVNGNPGKLHLIGDSIHYVGLNTLYTAPATMVFGHDNTSKKTTTESVFNITLGQIPMQPHVCNVDLASSISGVKPGNNMELEVNIDGSYYKIGTFEVDAPSHDLHQRGASRKLVSRSYAMRRLGQWESDAPYDYWSQDGVDADPVKLTELIRATGLWTDVGGGEGLQLDQLNVDGYLYSVAKASRNGVIRGKFKPVTANFGADFGVGLNFYRESRYDASKRLGVEMSEVTELDYGNHGIFAVYGPEQNSGSPGIGLYRLNLDTFELLTSVAATFSLDTVYWLMLQFQEGYIRVFYRLDTADTWTLAITHTYEQTDTRPWARIIYGVDDNNPEIVDNAGRGCMYIRNKSPYSTCFFFGSQSLLIPVNSNAPFASSGQVLVDKERIDYNGKSTNNLVGPFGLADGATIEEYTTIGATSVNFGGTNNPNVVHQSVNVSGTVSAVDVYVGKTGSPRDLKVSIYRPPITGSNPLGTLLGAVLIPASSIPASPGWVKATFQYPVNIQPGYWITMHQKNPSDENPANYFTTVIGGDYTGGIFQQFNDGNDNWTTRTGDMPFKIYGSLDPLPDGSYAVFVTGVPNASYTGEALCVTDGGGKNKLFKITGFSYNASVQTIFVDEDPRLLDADSELYIAPTLTVTLRGANNTIATAHARDAIVSTYDTPQVYAQRVQHYSHEQDIPLHQMIQEISRKAGVLDTDIKYEISGTANISALSIPGSYSASRKNFFVELEATWGTPPIGVCALADSSNAVVVMVDGSNLKYYRWTTPTLLLRESYPIGFTPVGKVAFSFQKDRLSVWCNGRFIHTFTIQANDLTLAGTSAGVVADGSANVDVFWSEADMRIDNFVIDIGTRGSRLISQLIGEKRVFWCEDELGRLRVYQKRETITGPVAYDISGGDIDTDANLLTRVRVEGAEVHEKVDPALIKEYGNIFRLINASEVNDSNDAERVAGEILDDSGDHVHIVHLTGAIDPRVECDDILETTNWGDVIISSISIQIAQMDTAVVGDMTVEGRWQKADLPI